MACGDSPTPSTVRQGIDQNLVAVLDEALAALDSEATAQVPLDAVERILSIVDGESNVATLVHTSLRQSTAVQALTGDSQAGYDGTKASTWLQANIFSDANHRGDGVFRIPAALVCATADADEETGDPAGIVDLACVTAVTKIDPKIKVRGDADELEFSLLLGKSENEPLSLSLSRSVITFHFDLDEAGQTIDELAKTFGGSPPTLRSAGRLAVGLEVKGPQHVVFKGTIERGIDFAFAENGDTLDSPTALRISTAAAPLYVVDIDGKNATLTASLGVGTTKIHAPENEQDPMIDIAISAITGALSVMPGQPIKLTGLSLGKGPLTIDVDRVRAATIDLNPETGRSFDLTVNEAAGEASFAVSPSLDLRMTIDAAALGEPDEPFAVTRLLFDGASPTIATHGTQLKIASGRLAVTTNPASFGFEASAGECLAERGDSGTPSRTVVVPCAP